MNFEIGQKIMTPDGEGVIVKFEAINPLRHEMNYPITYNQYVIGIGVKHDIFPDNKPRMYKDDILYYTANQLSLN
jgi:hypothetical protein